MTCGNLVTDKSRVSFFSHPSTPSSRTLIPFSFTVGNETEGYRHFEELRAEGEMHQKKVEGERALYPLCNSMWTPETGSKLWCEPSAPKRYPRIFTPLSGSAKRCACVTESDMGDDSLTGRIETYKNCEGLKDECMYS